ncbi:MAG: hypothetical protein JO358_19005 [Alphaproteobacteria bacterium]|nr:hypothetical protein [Alphaproteobacteria bacterium]
MLKRADVFRVAHLMLHQYGGEAEDEAARIADLMRDRGDWEALLAWTTIRQTIAAMDQASTGLPN